MKNGLDSVYVKSRVHWDLTAPTQGRHVRGLRDGGDRLERGSRDIQDVEETEHN